MAQAVDYFRSAAAERQGISDLRKQLDEKVYALAAEIEKLRQEIRKREDMLSRPSNPDSNQQVNDNMQRADVLREVEDMRNQISRKEQDAGKVRKDILDKIAERERDINDINSKAVEFETKS